MTTSANPPAAAPSPLLAAALELAPRLTAWRRHLHAHPELSGQERRTAQYIAAELRRLGWEPLEDVGGTFGLTATLPGAAPAGPLIALRADMDALPITEESGAEYASLTPGVMHACGHDAHVAMLLGAARLLAERRGELKHAVRLIFQPAEERGGGAEPLIAAGVLDGVTAVFGLHIWSEMPTGTLGTRVGPFMSSPGELEIVVRGRGGHAAMPQQCVDPVLVAAEIVIALQSVVSRGIAMTDSAVVSITAVSGGTATNIIPESVRMLGTIRTLSAATQATVNARVRALADGIARAHGATADVTIAGGYPVLVNDKAAVERALAAAAAVGFAEERLLTLPPQGGGEDFAAYAQRVPGAFLFLGARNETKACAFPHHHPRFNIDEDALPLGAALLAQLAL